MNLTIFFHVKDLKIFTFYVRLIDDRRKTKQETLDLTRKLFFWFAQLLVIELYLTAMISIDTFSLNFLLQLCPKSTEGCTSGTLFTYSVHALGF